MKAQSPPPSATSAGYFEAAGIPLLAGRGLSDSDTGDSALTARRASRVDPLTALRED